jgi:hypothetical protein
MKSMQNNEQIMTSFQKMGNLIGMNSNPNFEQMTTNMQQFEKCMDDMMINGKMMEEVMNQDNNAVDSTADHMLEALKG